MINEIQYTSIREIAANIKEHPLMQDVSLESIIRYALQFISKIGAPKLYNDKEESVHIEEYRGLLPCDVIRINQVKDLSTNVCLKSMTDTFTPNSASYDMSFKTQGRVIYTSFKTGDILISYKAIPIDEDGFPLIADNEIFKSAIEAYIKKQVFTVLFDLGKINNQVLQYAQQDYAFLAGQCKNEFTIPSISEMESIKNTWCSLIQKNNKFYDGFKTLGSPNNMRNI